MVVWLSSTGAIHLRSSCGGATLTKHSVTPEQWRFALATKAKVCGTCKRVIRDSETFNAAFSEVVRRFENRGVSISEIEEVLAEVGVEIRLLLYPPTGKSPRVLRSSLGVVESYMLNHNILPMKFRCSYPEGEFNDIKTKAEHCCAGCRSLAECDMQLFITTHADQFNEVF